jgi:hypothetical protein
MTADPAKEPEVRRRLSILFKNNAQMVDAYIAEFGTDFQMKNIQTIRDKYPGQGETGVQSALPQFPGLVHISKYPPRGLSPESLDLNSERCPVYTRICDCPICGKWGLTGYELKAKSLVAEDDPFLAPVYKPATPLIDPLNYLTANITVCDKCFFASPDRKDFIQYNKITRQNEPSQLSDSVIRELKEPESMDQRKALVEASGVGKELFEVPRHIAAACLSYQLCDLRAEAEAAGKILGANFKRGSYWLRIALLQRQAGMDDKPSLKIALDQFKTAFMTSDFPKPELEYHTLYVLFNLHMYLGQLKEGRDYVSVMENTKQSMEKGEVESTPSTLASLKKWIERAKNRWEDRESPSIWKTPGIEG